MKNLQELVKSYHNKVDQIAKSNLNNDQKQLIKQILLSVSKEKGADELLIQEVYQLLIQRVKIGFTFDAAPATKVDTIAYLKKNEELSFTGNENKIQNTLIIGENYDALKNLIFVETERERERERDNFGYDVIYIDPPYNTERSASEGNKVADNNETIAAKKFIYRDKFSRNGWLNMIKERLELAKQLLNNEGVIFVSIDDSEQAYLKVLLDEIFGEDNFITNFIWEKNYSPKNNNKFVSVNHDYILCYAKNKDHIKKFNRFKRSEKNNKLYIHNDNDGRGFYKKADLTKRTKNKYDIVWNSKIYKCPENSGWLYNKKRMYELIEEGRIWLPEDQNKRPALKIHLDSVSDVVSLSILPYKLVGHTEEAFNKLKEVIGNSDFGTPKSVRLIKYLIKLASKENLRVLDFYAGSGTTAQAALELKNEENLNIEYTLITNNENNIAYNVTYERLYRINKGLGFNKKENFEWIKNNNPFNANLNVFEIKYKNIAINNNEKLEDLLSEVNEMLINFGIKNFELSTDKILSKLRSLKAIGD
ncbi:C-terminal truncated Type III restriction-modification system: methylase [Mycoplasmopsis citelli]|uniref:C-terminal truncated Type III restriction-modification system: methylase n=1 Tax=Mycoplasmopsis citelli TaxID=171281 RepID=A0A449B1J8_9BACT|nr:site-specific DNA-methyltransferase [Mycoplasmopsis citelli]VEU74443.1 C-terminal truncated Type III restriction-modification system: methylase [Mycoplasmopsis citelli]